MDDAHADAYAFSGYRLDRRSRCLLAADGSRRALSSRAFDVLDHLVVHRERIVDKDELLRAAWPGRVVDENNLTQAISAIRRALGTRGGEHEIVLTVPGRGYRFIAPVQPLGVERRRTQDVSASPGKAACAVPVSGPGSGSSRTRYFAWAAFVLVGAVAVGAFVTTDGASDAAPAACEDAASIRDLEVARYARERYGEGNAHRAHAALRSTLARDPRCGAAYGLLAELYLADILSRDGDPRVLMPLASAALRRALERAPNDPDVRYAQGKLLLWRDRDVRGAQRAFAAAGRPDHAEALLGLALIASMQGRDTTSARLATDASRMDALSPAAAIAAAALSSEQEGAALALRARAADPGYWGAALQAGALREAAGDPVGAAADYRMAVRLSGSNSRSLAALARALAAQGDVEAARRIADALEARATTRYISPTMRAAAHAAAGNTAHALARLEDAAAIGDPLLLMAERHASFLLLESDPRFAALQARIRPRR